MYDGKHKNKLQVLLEDLSNCVVRDHRTSADTADRYVGVTGHFIDGVWNLNSFAPIVMRTLYCTVLVPQATRSTILLSLSQVFLMCLFKTLYMVLRFHLYSLIISETKEHRNDPWWSTLKSTWD